VNPLDEHQLSLATSYVRLNKVAKEVAKEVETKMSTNSVGNPSEYDWSNV
jgi:hypothetical protein